MQDLLRMAIESSEQHILIAKFLCDASEDAAYPASEWRLKSLERVRPADHNHKNCGKQFQLYGNEPIVHSAK